MRVNRGGDWENVPVDGEPWTVATGILSFAQELTAGKSPPVTSDRARHVIDVTDSTLRAAHECRIVELTTTFAEPSFG